MKSVERRANNYVFFSEETFGAGEQYIIKSEIIEKYLRARIRKYKEKILSLHANNKIIDKEV